MIASSAAPFRLRSRTAMLLLAVGCVASLVSCVTEKSTRSQPTLTDSSPQNRARPDTSALKTYVPTGLSTSTSAVSAAIGPLGTIEYDGNLIPLVSPGGDFFAVQGGRPAPSWGTILAQESMQSLPSLDVIVYRIEKVNDGPRQRLVEHRHLTDVGLIGRYADETGFIVESPQPDGSRRIGWVQWSTGELTWMLRSGVNAFATRSPTGLLAWCERVEGGASPRFDLFVQGRNEVYRAGDGQGSWLMPVWSNDSETLFAFNLKPGGELDLVVFDARSAASMRVPLQRERLTDKGSVSTVFQALAGIQSPAAPDGSPRLLFYHAGQDRIFEYDARQPEGRRVRGLPAPSIAAAWHTGDGVVYSGRSALYYQFLRDGSAPVELLKGPGVPRTTSNPMHPFVLAAIDQKASFQLNLWAMDLVDEDTVRTATEQMDPTTAAKSQRR